MEPYSYTLILFNTVVLKPILKSLKMAYFSILLISSI